MKTDISVWENSSGMMFIAWYERHTSVIYPDEPGNLEAMANIAGTNVETVIAAVDKCKTERSQE